MGALNSSSSERGLRAMGYRVADWHRQWQSRWLIAHLFIRDNCNATSRSQHWQIPTKPGIPTANFRRVGPGMRSPSTGFALDEMPPQFYLGCTGGGGFRCRAARRKRPYVRSLPKKETRYGRGKNSFDLDQRCRPAGSRPSPPSPPQMTSSTLSSPKPSGKPPRYEQKSLTTDSG